MLEMKKTDFTRPVIEALDLFWKQLKHKRYRFEECTGLEL